MLQNIIDIFNQLWSSIISFLPGSPFHAFIVNLDGFPYMAQLNWFLPLYEMFVICEAWLTAIALYYIYSAIMRFIRLL